MLKKMFSTLFLIGIFVGTGLVGVAQSPSTGGGMLDIIRQIQEQQRKALQGSWMLTINSLANQFNPSYALLSINEGGSAISAQVADISAVPNAVWGVPVIQTPKFGSWIHKGGRNFALSEYSLYYFSVTRDTDPRQYLGITKFWLNITLDESGNSFTATIVKVERINFAGQIIPLPSPSGDTVQGVRITAEP